jgi:hypothetical protein
MSSLWKGRIKMANRSVIAVPSLSPDVAGAIVYWRLSGDTMFDKLETAWGSLGLPTNQLPSLPGPATALRRAVGDQRAVRFLARPLEGRQGWALVEEQADGNDLAYKIILKVKTNDIGRLDFFDQSYSEQARSAMAAIQVSYSHHLEVLSPTDISSWIVDLASVCDAVLLRDTGGIYFIPRHSNRAWHEMVSAIRTASDHAVFEIPALQSDEAVSAILDAVSREAQSAADEIDEELNGEDELSTIVLSNRKRVVQKVKEKVQRYEQLLSTNLDSLHARLNALDANLTAATLAAMAE